MDIGWDPFGDIADLRERINRIFDQSTRRRSGMPETSDARPWSPRVDIRETAESLVFEAELPGFSRDDIAIELDGDRLTISGERKPPDGRDYVRVERPYGPFHRSFAIGVPIDRSGASAKYRDGVLVVSLPKADQPQPRQVKVRVE